MMLELILTRGGKDIDIRESILENIQFLVFDELHTYRGRQGSDVSMLIRRIKSGAKNKKVVCIGTSATMVSSDDSTLLEQREKVAEIASTIFGTDIHSNQVVNEHLIKSLSVDDVPTIANLQSAISEAVNIDSPASEFEEHPTAKWIEEEIALEKREGKWVRRKPVQITSIAEALALATSLPIKDCIQHIQSLLQWANKLNSNRSKSKNYLPYRLHQFIAQTGLVYSTLGDQDARLLELNAGLYSQEKATMLFPMMFSRTSGHEFSCVKLSHRESKLYPREFYDILEEDDEGSKEEGYIFIQHKEDEEAIWDKERDIQDLPETWFNPPKKDGTRVIRTERVDRLPRKIYFDKQGNFSFYETKEFEGWYISSPLMFDPTSGALFDSHTAEWTKLMKLGGEGRSTATTVLSFETITQLQAFDEPDEKQKLLSFTQRYRELQMPKNLTDEKYKFRLVQAFQDKWRKYEQGQMSFTQLMSGNPFGNLLYMGMVPSIFNHMLKEKPADFEQLLLALYDEAKPLKDRIANYLTDFATAYFSLNNAGKNTGQDERTIATLLTFRYPDKYTLFKWGFYSPLSKSFGVKPKRTGEQLGHYYSMVEDLVSALNSYRDIYSWEADNLDADCYPDPNHLLLAQDIFYTLLDSKESEPTILPGADDNDEAHPSPPENTTDNNTEKKEKMNHPLNLILYGPPGTGKTYNTVNRAIAIANPDFSTTGKTRQEIKTEYDRLVKDGRISFCTFHQSLGYEDFIEGIKPKLDGDNLLYELVPGIFRSISSRAAYVPDQQTAVFSLTPEEFENGHFYKMSLGSTQNPDDDEIYEFCIEKGYVALGWGGYNNYTGKNVAEVNQIASTAKLSDFERGAIRMFIHDLKVGDFVIVTNGNYFFRAIGKVTGSYEYRPDEIEYPHLRKVEWLLKNEHIPVDEVYNKIFSQRSIYRLNWYGIKKEFFVKGAKGNGKQIVPGNYVLVIDEINRGNVSAIFGELITLLEEDKRKGNKEELSAILPYSREQFSVPNNLYIIGTMNTADRSVEALDTALRRRFSFEEMMPNENMDEIRTLNISGSVIDFKEVLRTINKRLEKLVSRDHRIGHSYFICGDAETWEYFLRAFSDKIIPLLQEYFYGDYAKMCLVLGKGFVDANTTLSDDRDDKFFAAGEHDALDDFKSKKAWSVKNIATEDEFARALETLLNK